MNDRIEVSTSDYAIGSAPQILATFGVGSCVVVCLYDKIRKSGALLHAMLPEMGQEKLNPMRFVNTAVSIVLYKLSEKGIGKENLTAKIVGGAHMFKTVGPISDLGIRNVEASKQALGLYNIKIEAEDTGGKVGRNLEFDLSTGSVKILTKVVK